MPDISDINLLETYHRHASEEAFAELVRRHVNLVYSTALRHAGIPAHAEEIAQAVFVILARKAAALRPDTVLEAWLYETTRFTSLSFLRGERRRQFREQEAYMESTLHESTGDSTWNQIARCSTKQWRGSVKETGKPSCFVFLKRRTSVKSPSP